MANRERMAKKNQKSARVHFMKMRTIPAVYCAL